MSSVPPAHVLPSTQASQERAHQGGQAQSLLRRFARGHTAPSSLPVKGDAAPVRPVTEASAVPPAAVVGLMTLGDLVAHVSGGAPRTVDRQVLEEDGWYPRDVLARADSMPPRTGASLAAGALSKLKHLRG